MDYLTIMEAARRSGKSDKTIRRAIHKGLLAAHFPQPNRCEIAIKDLDAFLHGQVSGQLESLHNGLPSWKVGSRLLKRRSSACWRSQKRWERIGSPPHESEWLACFPGTWCHCCPLPRCTMCLRPLCMGPSRWGCCRSNGEAGRNETVLLSPWPWTRKDSTRCTNSTMTCPPLWPVISVLTQHLDRLSRHTNRKQAPPRRVWEDSQQVIKLDTCPVDDLA